MPGQAREASSLDILGAHTRPTPECEPELSEHTEVKTPGQETWLCVVLTSCSLFEPQYALLKNGHNNTTKPISIHSFIQHIFIEHPAG